MSAPDRFMAYLDQVGYSYASVEEVVGAADLLSQGTTTSGSRQSIHYAISAIRAGRHDLADRFFDMVEDKVGHSSKVHLIYWSRKEGTKRVISFSAPLDDFKIMIKEYYCKDGTPDMGKLDVLFAMNAALTDAAESRAGFPLVEIVTRTEHRQLSLKRPGNLAFEHSADDSGIWDGIISDALAFEEFVAERPEFLARARREDYARKYLESLDALEPFCGRNLRRYRKRDARNLERSLEAQRYVPQFDIVSTNIIIEPDGRRRYIDMEKVPDLLVNRYHFFAHTWFDPRRPSSFEERCEGLGREGLPAALYYVTRQLQRLVSENVPAPFSRGELTVYRRFGSYLEMLHRLGGIVWLRDEFPSLRELMNIDTQKAWAALRKTRS